ncbi:MAG TPA: LysM peptidoglycan-binding domain-containing protein [Kofleriaceae bacterium]|nr:LysM peptidoglycan-binding domain-containing protein [Kofleriaceae bacterium]
MKKLLLGLVIVPGVAAAQVPPTGGMVPGYPTQTAPTTLDPGAAPPAPTPAPAPAKPAPAQKPNVVVVGPDGKVTYDPNQQQGSGAAPAGGYYYTPPEGDAPFGYDTGGEEPVTVHSGATPELHVVRKGDTLWDICFYYFNDPWQWPKVWSYNPQITNPHWIYPGDLVRLLPKGVFEAQNTAEPEKGPDAGTQVTKPVENLPPPATRTNVGLKQTAFVEKSDLDKSIVVDGAVDEKELLSIGDSIYLSYPPNNPPKIGQRYSIYKPDNTVKSNGKDQGAYVHVLGTVEVVSVKQDKKARGVIVEANEEIERGAKVGPLMKTFKNVNPVPPKVDAQGTIVAMLRGDQLIGQGEVVFIDLGKSSGIEIGNRMFVVRRGDAMPPHVKQNVGQDDRKFPARSLGEVVIVDIGDKISIGLVTLSVQEFDIGDIVMMQKAQ